MEQRNQTGAGDVVFETFGSYLFLKRLAAGGMAEVFLARPATHVGNGRVQVVKRILPHVANNPVFLNMFQTEIQVIMGFNHPHTVQLHDSGEYNNQPYIAMEYIEGKNLKEFMTKFHQKSEMIPVPTVLSLIAQAASGLSYAHTFVNKVTGHTVNAIHRDISPHNLILSYEGNLKVIDFGIAKAASGMMQEQTRAGTIKGKTAYLSPEQVKGQAIDARSDVFALGIVAWELLTLRRPFTKDGDSEINIIGRIDNCDEHIVPPSQFNSAVPKEVDEIVLKALRKDPQARFATASEFQTTLRQVMQQYYPTYSYADTGNLVKNLFAEEILAERKELQKLNMQAQEALSSHLDAKTLLVEGQRHQPVHHGGVVSGMFNGIRAIVPGVTGTEHVDARLTKIESMIKQKASGRHYMLFAFYVISLIALKLDTHYSLFSFLLPEQEVSANTGSPIVAANGSAAKLRANQVQAQQPHAIAKSRKPAAAVSGSSKNQSRSAKVKKSKKKARRDSDE